VHECRPSKTFTYRLHGLYYSFHAMLGVPLRSYFSPHNSETSS
jgi:hypothetical protein